MHFDYINSDVLGISKAHRGLLSSLHRSHSGPFTVAEAAEALSLPLGRTRKLLSYWTSRGWLSRVRRGVYTTVPLEAVNPSRWRSDPWVVAETLFRPCYVGGWSAAEHWGLTDQIFADLVVFTASYIRKRTQTVQGANYLLVAIPEARLFGLSPVWRETTKTLVSDAARTVVDILDRPPIGGGIKHVAEIVREFFEGEHRDDDALVDYARRIGNRTIRKRLGYIVERLGLDVPRVLSFCRTNMSAGYSRLDPSISRRGRLLRKWNLDINVSIGRWVEGSE